jgi:tRNA U38,U39,U40 pseudouridine synthase TruA
MHVRFSIDIYLTVNSLYTSFNNSYSYCSKCYKGTIDIHLHFCSTDGGVHALSATAHVDLERYGSKIYECHNIAYNLNKFFFKSNCPIFIRNCIRVPDHFNARYYALSRTYLYR